MTLFHPFHKSAFWSQFFIGIIAIFALPTTQPLAQECEQKPLNQQVLRLSDLTATQKIELEQAHLVHLEQQPLFIESRQAVVFCEFFAKSYRLYFASNPPIRAGPDYS